MAKIIRYKKILCIYILSTGTGLGIVGSIHAVNRIDRQNNQRTKEYVVFTSILSTNETVNGKPVKILSFIQPNNDHLLGTVTAIENNDETRTFIEQLRNLTDYKYINGNFEDVPGAFTVVEVNKSTPEASKMAYALSTASNILPIMAENNDNSINIQGFDMNTNTFNEYEYIVDKQFIQDHENNLEQSVNAIMQDENLETDVQKDEQDQSVTTMSYSVNGQQVMSCTCTLISDNIVTPVNNTIMEQ